MPTIKEIIKTLKWLANETEFTFAKEQLTSATDLIESLTARAEAAERERAAAVEDMETLLGQEDYIGVCWACANDCKKGDNCNPKWRGSQQTGKERK